MAGVVERSTHENKYDRQLRLWGHHGQRALEDSHVLILGAGPIAAETLKNLVLPSNYTTFSVITHSIRQTWLSLLSLTLRQSAGRI